LYVAIRQGGVENPVAVGVDAVLLDDYLPSDGRVAERRSVVLEPDVHAALRLGRVLEEVDLVLENVARGRVPRRSFAFSRARLPGREGAGGRRVFFIDIPSGPD